MKDCEATIGLDAGEYDPFPCELEAGHAGPHVFQGDQAAYRQEAGELVEFTQKYKVTWEEAPLPDKR